MDLDRLIREAASLRRLAVELVGPSAAEDVVQDALAAGLRSAPDDSGALRPWLARVVRNLSASRHRATGRRAERESAAARREGVPSAGDLVERMEVQRVVAEEVLALAEPYRAAILAVHLEGVSAEEFARARGVPAATVRSWTKRGLDTLRLRLDRRFGGRGAWSACFVPLARPESTLLSAAAAGGLAMKKVWIAAVTVFALFVAWLVVPDGDPANVEPVGPPASVAAGDARAPGAEVAPKPASGERTSSASPLVGARPPGIHGRVVWFPDRTPAAGIGVFAGHPDRPDLGPPASVESGADGTFTIVDLAAGDYAVGVDRAPGTKRVVLAGGDSATVELELPRGPTVRGRVLDASGAPVAGADVYVSTFSEDWSFRAARSAADGTYAVEGLAVGPRLHARTAGHSASAAYLLQGQADPYALDLWLGGEPGAIEGTMLDADGRPAVGVALVLFDSGETVTDPAGVRSSLLARASGRTDALGRFTFEDVRPGRHRLSIHAFRGTVTSRYVEVRAGRSTQVDLALPQRARLSGRVASASGTPAVGARVEVLGVDGVETSTWIGTDAEGRYDTGLVPAGRVRLSVRHGTGKAHLETELAPGEERDWSPVLGSMASIRGRVVDADGRPLAGIAIAKAGTTTRPGGPAQVLATSDASGRFELAAADGQRLSIVAWQGDQIGARAQAWAGDPGVELVFEVPRARILGRVVDARGAPARDLALWIAPSLVVAIDAEGRFESPPLPSGRHDVSVTPYGVGRWRLATVELAAGARLDVGDLVLPGRGTLVVAVVPRNGVDASRVVAVATRRGDPENVVASHGTNLRNDWTAEGLPAGEYLLSMHGGGAALGERALTIEAGKSTFVEVEVHPGASVRVELRGDRLSRLRVAVRGESGTLVGERVLHEYEPAEWWVRLRPGRYEIEATTGDGRSGRATVEVAAGSDEDQVVSLDVR